MTAENRFSAGAFSVAIPSSHGFFRFSSWPQVESLEEQLVLSRQNGEELANALKAAKLKTQIEIEAKNKEYLETIKVRVPSESLRAKKPAAYELSGGGWGWKETIGWSDGPMGRVGGLGAFLGEMGVSEPG